MQDHYTGEFADYVKYALLRSLAPNPIRRLGFAWYKNASDCPPKYGNTIQYLDNPEEWRPLDPEVFDTLHDIVENRRRATSQIEASRLFPAARYANEPLPTDVADLNLRRQWRRDWFERTFDKLRDRNVVYIDPDTGICPNGDFAYGQLAKWQYIPMQELQRLEGDGQGNRRPVVVYHTPNRNSKHHQQIQYWKAQLNCDYAFHVPSREINGDILGPRVFFILSPDEPMVEALKTFSETWQGVGHIV